MCTTHYAPTCRLVLLACAIGLLIAPTTHATPTQATKQCLTRNHEGAPGWTWSRCGNHRRGVTLTDGSRTTPARCEFARHVVAGRIDWQRTGRLIGDRYAVAYATDRCDVRRAPLPAMR